MRYSADKNGGACDASDDEYSVARREAIQSGFGERSKKVSRKAQNAVNKKCNYTCQNFSFGG